MVCVATGIWVRVGAAQEAGATASPSPTPALQQAAPGVYRLGGVTLNKNTRQVRFPAVVNQTAGPVEYLLVGTGGKIHESVLRTDVEPTHVHTAMLLLGLKPQTVEGVPPPAPPANLDAAYLAAAPLPPGVPVRLGVCWRSAEAPDALVEHPAESLLDDASTKAAMSPGGWLYNGSLVAGGRFQAEVEKSFVAVVTDPAALVNNPRHGHDDETIWTAATARLPAVGTSVEFVIQLPPTIP